MSYRSVFIALLCMGRCLAGEISFKLNQYVFVGIDYGSKGMPGPFVGVWEIFLFKPSPDRGKIETHTFTWSKKSDHEIHLEQSCVDGADEFKLVRGSFYDSDIDLMNWSHGIYNQEERDDMMRRKNLLHYDKVPLPVLLNAAIDDDITITRHVLGYRNGEEVSLVIYKTSKLELLKKYHRYPEFFLWGRNAGNIYDR